MPVLYIPRAYEQDVKYFSSIITSSSVFYYLVWLFCDRAISQTVDDNPSQNIILRIIGYVAFSVKATFATWIKPANVLAACDRPAFPI